MPLLELRILEIHSFPHFSLTCFDMLSWNFAYDFVLQFTVLQIKFECRQFASIFVGVLPLLEYWNTGNTVFCTFSYMLWDTCIELKFCIWLCFTVLQINFECRQFASIFVGVLPLLEIGTFNTGNTQFSALFSYMLWHIELKFFIWLCLMYL